MSVENEIREFLLGNIDIITFRQKYDSNDDINDFLNRLTYLYQLSQQSSQQQLPAIHLLTFHASKGLEFNDVYLIDCMDGITPSSSA